MSKRHRIRFPSLDSHGLGQNEAFFFLEEEGRREEIRFHDYGQIYSRPGLYEQVFYERLKCSSPKKVSEILKKTVEVTGGHFSELRVLDLGAGNGMMGEALNAHGVARMVGIDIIGEAREAAERDRPGLYDEYFVMDLTRISKPEMEELRTWSFDCLTCVAALGFGDIPPQAFVTALNIVAKQSWVAFNIKESFLDHRDTTGFSVLVRELLFSDHLDLYHLERYRHRLSIDGKPLYYFAVAGRKNDDIPESWMQSARSLIL